jgi:hypothetical protein
MTTTTTSDVDHSSIPAELRELRQWVVWKFVPAEPKPGKLPCNPVTGMPASSTNPASWATFAEAEAALRPNRGYAGVGFVFSEEDPYVGIDLDHMRDAATGKLTAQAQEIVTRIASYTEVSPSGSGVHILVRGSLDGLQGRKKGDIEIYESGRFFTVTGDHLPDTPSEINDRQPELRQLHHEVFGDRGPRRPEPDKAASAVSKTDEEVVSGLRASDRADEFEALWGGNWDREHFPSQSEADLALATMLVDPCCRDTAQIDRIFRKSRLYRPKWDENRGGNTYGERTIEKALEIVDMCEESTSALAQMNARYAVAKLGGSVRVLDEERNADGQVIRVSFMSKQDFLTHTQHLRSPEEKPRPRGLWWISHPLRRTYDAVDFLPGANDLQVYNLWRGFSVAPQAGGCPRFWTFVLDVIAQGNHEVYAYIRRWCAHMVQHPDELPEVALVLRGRQGTGKNTFVDTLGALVEAHYRTVVRMEHVAGKFNAHLQGALLVHANEAIWGGNKADAGALKALITDRTISMEGKGRDRTEIRNFARLIVSSNEQWAVHVDVDDRRFLVADVSDAHQRDHAYFKAIHDELEAGGLSALMHDLMHENLTGFHPRNKPQTQYGADLKLQSADSVTRWWYEVLDKGELPVDRLYGEYVSDMSGGVWPDDITKDTLFREYQVFCKEQGERHPCRQSDLFKRLKVLAPSCRDYRPKAARPGPRGRRLKLCSLKKARAEFEAVIGEKGKLAWSR